MNIIHVKMVKEKKLDQTRKKKRKENESQIKRGKRGWWSRVEDKIEDNAEKFKLMVCAFIGY